MIKGNTTGKLDYTKSKLHKEYFLMIKPLPFCWSHSITFGSHQTKLLKDQASSPHPPFKSYHHHLSTCRNTDVIAPNLCQAESH